MASLAGLGPLLSARSAGRAASAGIVAADSVRRAAVATLFAVHTIRFGIYLRPDQGRRAPPPPGRQPGRARMRPAVAAMTMEVIRTRSGQMPA